MTMNQNDIKGFSLIELLIAIVILGILTAMAYPSYMAYLLKSRRADALGTLSQDQIILERCYSQNFSYITACGALPAFPQTSPRGYYSIALSNAGATSYTLTATAIGTQVKDTKCITFTVNQAGVKTGTDSSGSAQTSCWNP